MVDRNDRSIATFTGLGHGTLHGFELSIPLLIPLWLTEFDASPTTLGIVVGAGYALTGLVAPLAGVVSDRYRSKCRYARTHPDNVYSMSTPVRSTWRSFSRRPLL